MLAGDRFVTWMAGWMLYNAVFMLYGSSGRVVYLPQDKRYIVLSHLISTCGSVCLLHPLAILNLVSSTRYLHGLESHLPFMPSFVECAQL